MQTKSWHGQTCEEWGKRVRWRMATRYREGRGLWVLCAQQGSRGVQMVTAWRSGWTGRLQSNILVFFCYLTHNQVTTSGVFLIHTHYSLLTNALVSDLAGLAQGLWDCGSNRVLGSATASGWELQANRGQSQDLDIPEATNSPTKNIRQWDPAPVALCHPLLKRVTIKPLGGAI